MITGSETIINLLINYESLK